MKNREALGTDEIAGAHWTDIEEEYEIISAEEFEQIFDVKEEWRNMMKVAPDPQTAAILAVGTCIVRAIRGSG